MKRSVFIFIFVTMIVNFISAAGRNEFTGRTMAATYMTLNNSFFVELDTVIRAGCEAKGDRLLSYNPDYNQVSQIDQIQDMIAQNVGMIFLNPVDWKGIRPALEEAKMAGIPIVVVDAPVYDSELVISTITSDNYEAGRLIGLDLLARRKSAKIAVLDHPTNKPSIDRLNGFLDVIDGRTDIRVVARQSAFGSLEEANPLMENILQSHPDITVVFGTNDPTAIGAIAAIEAAKRIDDILVYSIDGSPEGQAMVREEKMTATAAQSPRRMGETAVAVAYSWLNGENVEKNILIPVTLINRGNVNLNPENTWR